MRLDIKDKNNVVIAQVSEFEFHDTFMGEQYIILTVKSPVRILWEIGDYAEYRGETFVLNYIPSCIQNSSVGENGDAFTYEQVKFNSFADELTSCSFRDITPTTSQYDTKEGTNYTGSTVFTLHCGQTVFGHYEGTEWVDDYLTPVTYLAGVIQSNLDAMYGVGVWSVNVNQSTTQTEAFNIEASHWTCRQALEQVYSTFKLNYAIRGRNIEIGCNLQNITGSDSEAFVFGYGKGYAKRGDDDKSLIKIERTADPSQQIVTRLRVSGSKKNLPYRYYHDTYGGIPASMFIQNLQLPDTFLPYGDESTENTKAYNNSRRGDSYLHVLGAENDAYIEKDNDAASTDEGLREGCVIFDGSGDLEEIYPTIKEVTYDELRTRLIPDLNGGVGELSYPYYGGGDNDERIDEVLSITEDTNVGSGIMTVSEVIGAETKYSVDLPQTTNFGSNSHTDYDVDEYIRRIGENFELLSCTAVRGGEYTMNTVTGGAYLCGFYFYSKIFIHSIGFQITAYRRTTSGSLFPLYIEARHTEFNLNTTIAYSEDYDLNDLLKNFPSVSLKAGESVVLYVRGVLYYRNDRVLDDYGPRVRFTRSDDFSENNFTLRLAPATQEFLNSPFTICLKDLGFDLGKAIEEGEDPKIVFDSGWCGGREFTLQKAEAKYSGTGKSGWTVTIKNRVQDDSINAYFPNENYPINPGDRFVLTGIAMPDSYIKVAELRLLQAAMDYLADNCETKFTYKPTISRIYLLRNIDENRAAGTPEKSIWNNLYAGYKFSMYTKSVSEAGDPVIVDNVTIQSITIYERKDGPEVDIVLNDNVEQSSYQKMVTQVDRIYGSIMNGNSSVNNAELTSTLYSLLVNKGNTLFLSKLTDDIAQGVIKFFKGIKIGTQSMFGFSEDGDVTARTLKATGSDGRATTDEDAVKNIGLDVKESGIIGGMLKVAKSIYTRTIQSLNFSGGATPAGTGWQLTDEDGTGHSKLTVDNLYVRVKAIFEELEVKKWSVTGGNHLFSNAANVVVRTDYYNSDNELIGYSTYVIPWLLRKIPLLANTLSTTSVAGKMLGIRKSIRVSLSSTDNVAKIRCYFYAKNDSQEVENWWRIGDLAYCKEMNVSSSTRQTYISNAITKAGNAVWWRRVVGVSGTPVEVDGKTYHYFDVSMSDCADNSDIPCAGDNVVQLGNVSNPDRMDAISIEVNGTDAPCIKAYRGIYTYNLQKSWWGGKAEKMKLSPATGYEFYGPQFKQVTEYGVKPVPNQLGEWDDLVNDENCRDDYAPHANVHKCHYYDQVTHNGSTWLCVITDELHWRVEPVEGEVVTIIYGGITYSEGDYIANDIYSALPDSDKAKCERVRDYTTEEPSSSSQDWLCTVEKGTNGKSAAYISVKGTANDGTANPHPEIVIFDGTTSTTVTDIAADTYEKDGETITQQRGHALIVINKSTLAVVSKQFYDTFGYEGRCTVLAEAIDALTDDYIVVLATRDACRFNSALVQSLVSCGSAGVAYTRAWRYPFAFIGMKGMERGTAAQMYSEDSSTHVATAMAYVENGTLLTAKSPESPVFADLTNEMDSVACTSDGKTTSAGYTGTTVSLMYGTEAITISSITASSAGNITVTSNVSIGLVTFSWDNNVAIAEHNAITLRIAGTRNGVTYTRNLVFTLNGVRAGANGDPAVLYRLVPSVDKVVLKKDGSYIPTGESYITCGVTKNVGGTESTPAASEYTLKYSLNGGSETTYTATSVKAKAITSNLVFILYVNGIVVDRETVPVVADGTDGLTVGENIINGNKSSHTHTVTDGETYYQTDRRYQASDMPADGTKVSGQARITLSGCTISSTSKVFLYIQAHESGSSGYGQIIFAQVVNPTNTTYDCTLENLNVDSDGVAWDEVVRVGIEGITGGTITVERVKLEVGSQCTAFTLSADDTVGEQGGNGIAVELSADSVLLTQDIESLTIDLSGAYTDVSVRNGSVSVDKADYTISASGTHCTVSVNQTSKRVTIEAIGSYTDSGSSYYYEDGYVTITISYDGNTYTKRFNFYCNTLGKWKDSVVGDAKTEVAESIDYALNGDDTGYSGFNNLGTYVRSSTQAVSRIEKAVHTIGNRNYFGFHRGLTFDGCIPAIQSYGVFCNLSSDAHSGILGLNLPAGNYVVSAEIKCSTSRTGQMTLGTVSKDISVSTSWKTIAVAFTTTGTSSQLAFYAGGSTPNLYIRHLKIEEGAEQTEFKIADEDMSYLTSNAASLEVRNAIASSVEGPTKATVYESSSLPTSGNSKDYVVTSSNYDSIAGKCYTAIFWLKSSTGSHRIYSLADALISSSTSIDIKSYTETENGQSEAIYSNGKTVILVPKNWTKYYVHFYAIASATPLTIRPIRLDGNITGNRSGTLYFTDVQFVEGYVDEVNADLNSSYSEIKQTAESIELKVNETGIDIEHGKIVLAADKVTFSNTGGTVNDKISIDPTTGTLHAVDGDFSGTIHAKNLFHGVCYFIEGAIYLDGDSEKWSYCYSVSGIDEEYRSLFAVGQYYSDRQIDEMTGGYYSSAIANSMLYCTYNADIVRMIPTIDNWTGSKTVKLPAPESFPGKIVDVSGRSLTLVEQDIYVGCVIQNRLSLGVYYDSGNLVNVDHGVLNELPITTGQTYRFHSQQVGSVYYWVKI